VSEDIVHNIEKGLLSLLQGPRDLDGGTPVPQRSPAAADAHPELRGLFEHYHQGYEFLQPHCMRWWRGCIAASHEAGMTRDEAVDAAYDRRLAGPASAPEFVWFIRHFWLLCDKANRELPLEQRVAPQDLLLQWLVYAGNHDAVQLCTAMPYWPIGMDVQGRWC
jgi:hypothetical protein